MNNKERKLLIKKLLYQSCNRGCKETNLLIGLFARNNIHNMNDEDLLSFLDILHVSDADIYDWYTKKKPLPKDKESDLMLRFLNFHLNK